MKKAQLMIAFLLVMGMAFSGTAFAERPGAGGFPHRGFKSQRPHGMMGFSLLTKYQLNNMRVQVLSRITKQPENIIRKKLRNSHLRAVLTEYKIDRKAFHDGMLAKMRRLVKQAAKNGSITPEQKKDILAKMEHQAQRRDIMAQLIEKGVKDGTITGEQARMLRHKTF